ncbi:MAG TPA: VOC family protein [Pyrinomonadaceae bacterium]|nr:VOC family protein [Pyrinomonadaceae bacterium]
MSTIHQITPFLHVRDLEEAISFFCEVLPFEVKFRESDYAYVELEGHGLRLLEESTRQLSPDGKARMTVYIDVPDVDALYETLRPALERLPSDRVKPLLNKAWRQREFQVRMPDGDWLTFGAPVG